MKIGIDARMFLNPKTGVGQYVANLLRAFAEVGPENEYYLYAPRPFKLSLPEGPFYMRIIPSRRSLWWMQVVLPRFLVQDGIDLYWGGNYAVPFLPRRIKKVVTLHDFVYKKYPGTLPVRTALHLRVALPLYLRSCHHVLVPSQNTAIDLQETYRFPGEKITVVHLAAGSAFFNKMEEKEVQDVLAKYNLSKGYLLYVGAVEPRKGVDTILKTLGVYRERNSECPFLVIAGPLGWKTKKIVSLVSELDLEKTVRFLGYVPDEDLPALYKGASIFLYPSLYEGFGLPVVEAMASGVPVITSRAASLPEVAGDAALFVNPGDEKELSMQLEKLLQDPVLRQEMGRKGKAQAERFSWLQTAKKTLQVFNAVYSCVTREQ